MLISAIFIVGRFRILIPAAALTLSMIPFCTVIISINALSLILPKKLINFIDDFFYTAYIRTTLFVFENISAVKVKIFYLIKIVT